MIIGICVLNVSIFFSFKRWHKILLSTFKDEPVIASLKTLEKGVVLYQPLSVK